MEQNKEFHTQTKRTVETCYNKICKEKHSNETVQLRKYIQKIFFNPQLFPSNAEKC